MATLNFGTCPAGGGLVSMRDHLRGLQARHSMYGNQGPRRLGYRGSIGSRAQNLIVKTFIVAGAGIAIVSAIAVSLVLFAIAITSVFLFGGYLWWKTRHLRKQMRTESTRGDVIEGVVIREDRVEQIRED